MLRLTLQCFIFCAFYANCVAAAELKLSSEDAVVLDNKTVFCSGFGLCRIKADGIADKAVTVQSTLYKDSVKFETKTVESVLYLSFDYAGVKVIDKPDSIEVRNQNGVVLTLCVYPVRVTFEDSAFKSRELAVYFLGDDSDGQGKLDYEVRPWVAELQKYIRFRALNSILCESTVSLSELMPTSEHGSVTVKYRAKSSGMSAMTAVLSVPDKQINVECAQRSGVYLNVRGAPPQSIKASDQDLKGIDAAFFKAFPEPRSKEVLHALDRLHAVLSKCGIPYLAEALPEFSAEMKKAVVAQSDIADEDLIMALAEQSIYRAPLPKGKGK